MSFNVLFEGRDFSRMSQPLGTFEVESMKWSCFGGADEAVLIEKSGYCTLQELQGLLRCPVCIFNDLGQAVWWGFVNGLRFGMGARGSHSNTEGYAPRGTQSDEPRIAHTLCPSVRGTGGPSWLNQEVIVSLDELWNRIAVKFRKIGLPYEEEYMSSWAENAKSIETYGTREKLIIQRKYSEDLEAEGIRDRILDEKAVLERELIQGSKHSDMRLKCRGWASTLDWKYQQDISGYIANDVVMVGVQNIGYLTIEGISLSKAGQAFVTTGAVDVRRVQIRIRKQGVPTDNILVSIQSDNSNMPSGTVLGQVTLIGAGLSDEGYSWVNCDFTTAVSLSASTKYWIVVERSAAVSLTDYYVLGMDESSSYMLQSFRYYSGSWVLAKKNMLFRVIGTKETTEQIEDIYNACNQFLTGIEVKADSGVHSQVYDRDLVRGWEKMLGLLKQGTDNGRMMLAKVNRDRKLVAWKQAEKGTSDCYVDGDGQFYDRLNNRMDEGIYPVGEWIQFKGQPEAGRYFIKELELNKHNLRYA